MDAFWPLNDEILQLTLILFLPQQRSSWPQNIRTGVTQELNVNHGTIQKVKGWSGVRIF